MRNQYRGVCCKCDKTVNTNEGEIDKTHAHWEITCDSCLSKQKRPKKKVSGGTATIPKPRYFLRLQDNISNYFTIGKIYPELPNKMVSGDRAIIIDNNGHKANRIVNKPLFWLEIPEHLRDEANFFYGRWLELNEDERKSFGEFANQRLTYLENAIQEGRANEVLTQVNLEPSKADQWLICHGVTSLDLAAKEGFDLDDEGEPFSLMHSRTRKFFQGALAVPYELMSKEYQAHSDLLKQCINPQLGKPIMLKIEHISYTTLNGVKVEDHTDNQILGLVSQQEMHIAELDRIKSASAAIDAMREKHRGNIDFLLGILDQRLVEQRKKDNPVSSFIVVNQIGNHNFSEWLHDKIKENAESKPGSTDPQSEVPVKPVDTNKDIGGN